MATNQNMRTFIGFSSTDYRMAKSLTEEERKVLGIDLEAIEKGLRAQGFADEHFQEKHISERVQEKRTQVEAKEHARFEENAPKIEE